MLWPIAYLGLHKVTKIIILKFLFWHECII